jgi:hypothetical protein
MAGAPRLNHGRSPHHRQAFCSYLLGAVRENMYSSNLGRDSGLGRCYRGGAGVGRGVCAVWPGCGCILVSGGGERPIGVNASAEQGLQAGDRNTQVNKFAGDQAWLEARGGCDAYAAGRDLTINNWVAAADKPGYG